MMATSGISGAVVGALLVVGAPGCSEVAARLSPEVKVAVRGEALEVRVPGWVRVCQDHDAVTLYKHEEERWRQVPWRLAHDYVLDEGRPVWNEDCAELRCIRGESVGRPTEAARPLRIPLVTRAYVGTTPVALDSGDNRLLPLFRTESLHGKLRVRADWYDSPKCEGAPKMAEVVVDVK